MDAPSPAEAMGFSRDEKRVIATCAIAMMIVRMDWFAPNRALLASRGLRRARTDLQWVVSGYMLSIGALKVTAVRLADISGRRRSS